MRRAWLVYTLGRLGLFGLSAIIVWGGAGLLGHDVNGAELLLGGLLLSSVLALVLLRGQRDAFAAALQARRDEKAETAAARRARLDDTPQG